MVNRREAERYLFAKPVSGIYAVWKLMHFLYSAFTARRQYNDISFNFVCKVFQEPPLKWISAQYFVFYTHSAYFREWNDI